MADTKTAIEKPATETDGKVKAVDDPKDRAERCLAAIEAVLKTHNCRIHAVAQLEPEIVGGGSKILVSSKTSWGVFPSPLDD